MGRFGVSKVLHHDVDGWFLLAYRFEDSGSAFCVPSFNATVEVFARVIDSIVVILIVDGSGEAVAEHTLRQRGKGIDRVLVQKSGRG